MNARAKIQLNFQSFWSDKQVINMIKQVKCRILVTCYHYDSMDHLWILY